MISNERKTATSIVKDVNGNIFSSQNEKKNRWKEHFEKILNRPQPDNPLVIEVEDDMIVEIDTGAIQKDEIIRAMKKRNKGKSGGIQVLMG